MVILELNFVNKLITKRDEQWIDTPNAGDHSYIDIGSIRDRQRNENHVLYYKVEHRENDKPYHMLRFKLSIDNQVLIVPERVARIIIEKAFVDVEG